MSIRLLNLQEDFMNPLTKTKRWVIKVGSSTVSSYKKSNDIDNHLPNIEIGLNIPFIEKLCDEISYLHQQGIEVVLVTSGAIAQGMAKLGWTKRPKNTSELQAAAAVGQMGLVQAYQNYLNPYQITAAQILLTHDDLSHRERYLNARSTIQNLLKYHVIPIINENDTVITSEIKFGDNDALASLVANLIDADLMILLTDQNGIYTDNPNTNPDAELIEVAEAAHPRLVEVAGNSGSDLGTGGMASKVFAAKRAGKSGIHTVIANGQTQNILKRLHRGEICGTLLLAGGNKISARKQWIVDHLQVNGWIEIDEGAYAALLQGKSLLPIGLKDVQGRFDRGDVISCLYNNQELARGISQYSSVEAKMIMRKNSDEIIDTLGYVYAEELIHRNDLVITAENLNI